MNQNTRPFSLILLGLALIGFLLAVTLTNSTPSLAHPEGPEHEHVKPNREDVKRAFEKDQQPPQTLPSLASTACSGGFAGPYPCNNVDLLAFMPLANIGGTRSNSAANDIWGWTDPQTGKEYAIIGRVFGTSFIDISNPVNPVYLGELVTHGAFGSSWRDIKVYNNHAFIVSEALNHGMQVFDLTQLRNVNNPPVTFAETAHYNKSAAAHNIVINEASGFAYSVGNSGKNSCSGGLHMINIQSPTSPTFAGCYSGDGYTHDAQCVIYSGPDTAHQGKEICFNSNEDTLTIVDVSNKSAPVQLSRTGYAGSGYTHQGWLTEDQVHFLLDDELDEVNNQHNTRTYIWNVSDLDNPVQVGSPPYFQSTEPNIDHNQYVKGNFSYQANYRAGLRILDISDIANGNLSEVAYFDVYPADNAPEFNGAWSNYPYFASGVVIISGIEQGLFIVQTNLSTGPTPTPTNTPTPTPTNTPTPTPTNTPDPGATMHVGDLDSSTTPPVKGKWGASVTITIHDGGHAPVADATVNGSWSTGTAASCLTNANGQCTISETNINGGSVTFTVTGVTHASNSYDAGANHDPDGDSNGTVINISRP